MKTARSKGFAFIEFKHREVAEIACKALNGYIMQNK
jgi:RNA recognition motif-containing protein